MTKILLGICLMIGGALCAMTFVGIIIGIPIFILGFWMVIRGIIGILWGVGKAGYSASKIIRDKN